MRRNAISLSGNSGPLIPHRGTYGEPHPAQRAGDSGSPRLRRPTGIDERALGGCGRRDRLRRGRRGLPAEQALAEQGAGPRAWQAVSDVFLSPLPAGDEPEHLERTGTELSAPQAPPEEGSAPPLDIRNFSGIDAVLAAGLGGGSLIYANVFMEPPEHVLADPRWPSTCRKADLDRFVKKFWPHPDRRFWPHPAVKGPRQG